MGVEEYCGLKQLHPPEKSSTEEVTKTAKLDFVILYHMEEEDSEGYSEIKYVDACNNCMDKRKTEALRTLQAHCL